jgi:hypothetical protein
MIWQPAQINYYSAMPRFFYLWHCRLPARRIAQRANSNAREYAKNGRWSATCD